MSPDPAVPDLDSLPGDLPAGERVLWQGRPNGWSLAWHGLHLPMLTAYFAILLAWYAAHACAGDRPATTAAIDILWMTAVALVPLGLVCLYAIWSARAALYTVTNRRVVMRIGIALPISFNLPFSRIETAGLKINADGSGSIALTLIPGEKIAYAVLWPHARPWRLSRPEPMLRCIPQAQAVAQTIARALASAAEMPIPALDHIVAGSAASAAAIA